MMNLEKMKQKKRTNTKSRVKKSLLAATTFLCLTTPLLQTQTAYDAVCVEDLNLKGIAGGLHFGKGIQDNGYGQFLSMLGYKLEERGKYLIKVDRYFASSKICSVCGHKKKELALSERIYLCECGNRMDRDVNAAVNILKEGKRIYKKCA